MGNSARNKIQPETLHFVTRGNGGLHADFTQTTINATKPTQSVGTKKIKKVLDFEIIEFIIHMHLLIANNKISVWDESPSVSSKGQRPYTQSLFLLEGTNG